MRDPFADLSPPWHRLLLVLFGAACTIIVVAGVRTVADLLTPVLLAGFLTLLVQPLLQWLRRLTGAALAVTLVALVVVLVGLVMMTFVGVSLRQLALELPRYRNEFRALLEAIVRKLAARGIDAGSYVASVLTGPAIARTMLGVWNALVNAVGDLLVTYIVFAFMLSGMTELERRGSRQARDHSPLAARFLAYSKTIRGYMGVRTVLGLAVALLEYLLLVIVGVDYALLWAVLSFLLGFVPNIGFVLSLLPPMLLALLGHGWPSALVVFFGYGVVNFLIDDVIGPRYVGHQMKVSALLSLLSVLFWTWLLGATGAFLAVPLTVLIADLAFGAPGRADGKPPELGVSAPIPTP